MSMSTRLLMSMYFCLGTKVEYFLFDIFFIINLKNVLTTLYFRFNWCNVFVCLFSEFSDHRDNHISQEVWQKARLPPPPSTWYSF